MLGAGPIRTFRTVFLPAILPAALSSGIRSLGRAIGVRLHRGRRWQHHPLRTLTAPIYVFGRSRAAPPIGRRRLRGAPALALALHGVARFIEKRTGARHAEG